MGDHDYNAECLKKFSASEAEFAVIKQRLTSIEETQRKQNGALDKIVEKLSDIREALAGKFSEIQTELVEFRRHSEQFEADVEQYRREREEHEREALGIRPEAEAVPTTKVGLFSTIEKRRPAAFWLILGFIASTVIWFGHDLIPRLIEKWIGGG